jgi:hypothetical protein
MLLPQLPISCRQARTGPPSRGTGAQTEVADGRPRLIARDERSKPMPVRNHSGQPCQAIVRHQPSVFTGNGGTNALT